MATPEQLKLERIRVMGEELGLLFDIVYNDLIWLKWKWTEFIELYGNGEKCIDLMNRSAPSLFFILQQTLFENVLLGLCRLTDRQGSGKDETASVKALAILISDPILKKQIQKAVSQAVSSTMFCRDWRNRTIAHKDRALAFGGSNVRPLEPASLERISLAFESLQEIVLILENHYFKSETTFDFLHLLNGGQGGLALLEMINDGFKFRNERDRKLQEIEDALEP